MTADLSIVIPIYNEEENIPELWRRLEAEMAGLPRSTEVIFVDDRSRDNSLSLLGDLAARERRVKVVALSRNFGHQRALTAGLDFANGSAVVLMDGDLQDDPAAIGRFVERWREGFQVVYAIREKRKEGFIKRAAFATFYRLQSAVSGITVPVDAGIFSLLDRKVVEQLRRMPERNRYISGLRAYAGFRQTGIAVERGPRHRGRPRVRIRDLFRLAFDGIFGFSTVPLKLATWLGLICAATSFVIGTIGLYYKLVLDRPFLSWAYGLTTTFFLGGVQLLALGIIGEYIGRIYEEVKGRPNYIVDRVIGGRENDERGDE
ncbi:MAG TPA: glycosyltransferase family 2 protein [Thermoanaerobaculia bacterium]|nr:glycosyltransferase family 2 protein [Thermoanaerobaculia bacterium]